jgi:choline dehydrogenase
VDSSWTIDMPSAVGMVVGGTRYNWSYNSEPEPWLDGRRIGTPRGRTLGGSSSINGMVYVRGHALDYDGWAQQGCSGWSYQEVLPYFIRSQHHAAGADAYRGDAGHLHVTPGDINTPLCAAFENQLMDAVLNENQKPRDAARAWIRANPQVLDSWLAGVSSRDGKPAMEVVKADLAP